MHRIAYSLHQLIAEIVVAAAVETVAVETVVVAVAVETVADAAAAVGHLRRIAYSLCPLSAEIVVAVAVETAAAVAAAEIVVAASSTLSNYYVHPHYPHYCAHPGVCTIDQSTSTRCLFLCLLNFSS